VYAESREAAIAGDLLEGFRGVLVSDFYAAYDSVPCAQQKCLIHLMRDINEDLHKNPFDSELKEIAGRFGSLLREIVETIDAHGLKARYLTKRKPSAMGFIEHVVGMKCVTEAGLALTKRTWSLERCMRRREFIAGFCIATALPARAQQTTSKMRRVGFLTRETDASVSTQIDAFRQRLGELGWVEGKTISIVYRDANGQLDRLRALAGELVAQNVDVIVTVNTPPSQAAKEVTSTIPIVIAVSADPVGAGLVQSLGNPGDNVTGLSLLAPDTDQKALDFLKQTRPKTNRVLMIVDPKNPGMMLRFKAIQTAVPKLAIELQPILAVSSIELVGALAVAAKNAPDSLFVLSPIYAAYRNEIVEFAIQMKVPILFDTSGLARETNALLSYGADISDLFRRAAMLVDKILKGAKPADLPVEQPTKFELVINLKTARALGIDVAPQLQQLADEVIE